MARSRKPSQLGCLKRPLKNRFFWRHSGCFMGGNNGDLGKKEITVEKVYT